MFKTVFRMRLLPTLLLLTVSWGLWRVLVGHPVRVYFTVIPVLLAFQVFLNDLLEVMLPKNRWFTFLMAPGTILHELSHAFAAALTGCDIKDISLFTLNPRTNVLGYVEYAQPKDKWTVLRDLIIGFAPFFACGMLLVLVFIYLQPDTRVFYSFDLSRVRGAEDFIDASFLFLKSFYTQALRLVLKNPTLLVLIYLGFCFGLGSAPSSIDFQESFGSLLKYPLSTLFLLIVLVSVVFVSEHPSYFGDFGRVFSNGVFFLLRWAVLVLVFSLSLLILALPVVFVLGRFFEIQGFSGKTIPVLATVAAYLLLGERLHKSVIYSLEASLLVFTITALLLRYSDFFVAKASGGKR